LTTKITELPKYERPYEKLSIQLAQKVLALGEESFENELRFLQNVSIEELKKIKGIGRVKAIRLKATFELAKRMANPVTNDIFVYSSEDVAKIFMDELRYEKREIVKLIILNNKNKVLRIQNISLGGTNL